MIARHEEFYERVGSDGTIGRFDVDPFGPEPSDVALSTTT